MTEIQLNILEAEVCANLKEADTWEIHETDIMRICQAESPFWPDLDKHFNAPSGLYTVRDKWHASHFEPTWFVFRRRR